jgi:aminoglycoside/choline kinase family phosphotransferase
MIGPDRLENQVYQDFGERLALSLPLPKIYAHNQENGFFLMTDLGEERLDRLINAGSPSDRRDLLLKVADLLAKWRGKAQEALIASPYLGHNPAFSRNFAKVYEWEYFLRGLALLGLEAPSPRLLSSGEKLLDNIPLTPWTIIHRDFQSRNLTLFNEEVYVLDWQGAREGPATYDLASFMYDPYTNLTDAERAYFLKAYEEKTGGLDLQESLDRIAPSRLAQAIGAYCHLADRGLPYGPYLLPALARLSLALDRLPGDYQPLKTYIAKAQARAKELFS